MELIIPLETACSTDKLRMKSALILIFCGYDSDKISTDSSLQRSNGNKEMEYLDVVDENGQPTGEIVSRDIAHRDGIRHRTAHVWIVRRNDHGYDILLQKRSMEKESFPGMYDTSSAGHIPAGSEPVESALRELREELGITATPGQLHFIGNFPDAYEKEFYGQMFRDNEVVWVYVFCETVDINTLVLQRSEVDEVRWFDVEAVWSEIQTDRSRICLSELGLNLLREYLRHN